MVKSYLFPKESAFIKWDDHQLVCKHIGAVDWKGKKKDGMTCLCCKSEAIGKLEHLNPTHAYRQRTDLKGKFQTILVKADDIGEGRQYWNLVQILTRRSETGIF